MQSLVKTHKCNITRWENIEHTRHMIQLVLDSNPLTAEELLHFNVVLGILCDETALWQRTDVIFSDWEKAGADI